MLNPHPTLIPRLDRTRPVRLRGLTDAWPLRSYEAWLAETATFRVRRAAALHEYGYAGPCCGRVPRAALSRWQNLELMIVLYSWEKGVAIG